MNASLETTLAIELFLNDNYLFRHNVLNGKVEFAVKSADDEPDFRPLTQEALNSIIRRAKKEQVCEKGSPKTEIMEFVHSEDVPTYNPIGDYLAHLPKWDGQNHIAKLFNRLPGITSEQPTKVRLVKAMVFPVVMYGCESWTVKKAECRRIDAFELWCWDRKSTRLNSSHTTVSRMPSSA